MDKTARRDFLKIGTALVSGFPAILKGAADLKPLRVGLVGCGGRGTGAAVQALRADDGCELAALADVFAEPIENCLGQIKKTVPSKVKAEPRKFTGLDAYTKLIESDLDVVLLATPPGFRPLHLRAAIASGKHVFCEKPVAIDVPGVRSVLETVKVARQKNLAIVAGFCWRYSNYIRETFDQMHSGAIGDIVAYHATYYTNPVKPMPAASKRPAGMGDVEWQIRNWYNFCWLCGDGLVEQAVHSVDKIAWAMHDQPPVSCVAVGGRQIPNEGGNIFDHFEVNYLYPNNVRAFVVHRQQDGCYNENADFILGSKGSCTIGTRGAMPRIVGAKEWTYQGEKNDMYQAEHDALFASIRKEKPINDGEWLASSTMLALMGRIAAYTGQQVTWEQAMNSQESIFPAKLDWNASLPVAEMPRPGVTRLV